MCGTVAHHRPAQYFGAPSSLLKKAIVAFFKKRQVQSKAPHGSQNSDFVAVLTIPSERPAASGRSMGWSSPLNTRAGC